MDGKEINQIIVAAKADLILLAKGMEIFVSTSEMMKSKVVQAMLNPNFSEGQAFLNNKTEKPVTLSVPDDDDEALVGLCCMLHGDGEYKAHLSNNTKSLLKFANLVDKYDCLAFATPDLRALFPGFPSAQEYDADLLEAMYLLDDFEGFEKYTRRLMMQLNHNSMVLSEESESDETRLEIYEAVCDREAELKKQLFKKIDAVVQYLLANLTPHCHKTRESDGPTWFGGLLVYQEHCCYLQRSAARYLQAFMASKLWPPAEHGADGMRALLHRAQEFEVDVGDIIADYEGDYGEDQRELDVLEEMCYDLEARVDLDTFSTTSFHRYMFEVPQVRDFGRT